MTIKVTPGSMVELECPESSLPLVKVGESYPLEAKEKQYSIIFIKDRLVGIGPQSAGDYEIRIKCSNGTEQSQSISLVALNQNELPEKEPPVNPFGLAFPMWFWIAILLAILFIAGGVWAVLRKISKKQAQPKKETEDAEATGQELLENYFRVMERGKWTSKEDPQAISELYSKGQEYLRAFLEYRLRFKASWATSHEFLGALKSAVLSFPSLHEISFQVEGLLNQADLVRFSKDTPPAEARENFIKNLYKIHKSVLSNTPNAEAAMSAPKGARKK